MQHVHTFTRDAKSGVLVFFEGGGGSKVSSVGGVVVDLVSTSVFIGIGRDWIVDSMQKICFGGFVDARWTQLTVLLPNFHRFTLDTSGLVSAIVNFDR